MSINIGVDIGISATKIALIETGQVLCHTCTNNSESQTTTEQTLNNLLFTNGILQKDIKEINMTGIGSYSQNFLCGLSVGKIDEFEAIGRGGLFLSGLEKCIVVSMGTGTAIVQAEHNIFKHLGGTGVSGGTLMGLSKLLLNIESFDELIKTAEHGNLSNIDIFISDVTSNEIKNLPPDAIASNFGKINESASREDIALGIINMVFQTIGRVSAFAAKSVDTKDLVVAGNLAKAPQAKQILEKIGESYGVKYYFPEYSEFTTAIGAAISSPHVSQNS